MRSSAWRLGSFSLNQGHGSSGYMSARFDLVSKDALNFVDTPAVLMAIEKSKAWSKLLTSHSLPA